MTSDRELARKVVEGGLLADGALQVPDDIDVPEKYELLGYLGRGGAGRVYLARDTLLDRRVAIKFLTDARSADVARFRREARLTARLDVASIVQVYEMGESAGSPYIAMQYLEGGNLGRPDLSLTQVLRAARQVASALAHAHRAGIIHRDIKPANILLDARCNAFVGDFGIARDLARSSGPTLSTEGQVMGTPALMPPEQARGDLRAIDARSDIYALGATLYLKLTGRYPFEQAGVVDVLHAVIHDEPPLPRSLKASIPRSLEALVTRCMNKCPLERYHTMDEVVADLDRYQAGTDVPHESGAWFGRLVRTVVGGPLPPPPPEPRDDSRATELEILRELSAWDANLYRTSRNICRHFGRLEAIVARLNGIVAARPGVAWARFYRGCALYRLGRLVPALDDIERSIDRVEDRAGGQFELGRVSLALYLRAQQDARQHVNRVGVAEHLEAARGLLDQAVVAFGEASTLNTHLPRWQAEMARAVRLLAEDDHDGCIAACDRILEAEPDAEEVWKLRGDALRFSGGDPFASYERAIAVRRCYHEASLAMADAWLQRGEWRRTREELGRTLDICPEYVDGLTLLARTHLEEAADEGRDEALQSGFAALERATGIDAEHYGAVTTRIELTLARYERERDAALLAGARRDVEHASNLAGCQNRVHLLDARIRLATARVAIEAGGDPRADLDAVSRMADEGERSVLDTRWQALRDEARRLRSTSRGGTGACAMDSQTPDGPA